MCTYREIIAFTPVYAQGDYDRLRPCTYSEIMTAYTCVSPRDRECGTVVTVGARPVRVAP